MFLPDIKSYYQDFKAINCFKMQKLGTLLILIEVILKISESAAPVAPVWITSTFVQAASNKVINNVLTGNSATPTATMNFAPAFSAPPNLGYGVTNYQGSDTFIQEKFQVWRTALTASLFSVSVKIVGVTNLWMLQVRYIAISKLFPHHLNSFDNVPVNYNNGAITNVSALSMSVKTYQNTINYTLQAGTISSTYLTFNPILTNNKILLFMTSLYIEGGTMDKTGTAYPINLYVDASPKTTSTYMLTVNYSMNSKLTKLHFSMIVFDQADVQSSGQYLLIYDKKCYDTNGGFYAFPSQFLTNFMVGFVEFSSPKTSSTIHYENNFLTVNSSHGVKMLPSVPRVSNPALTRFCFTYFYIKTWQCPSLTFFDSGTNMCIGCPIVNCRDCFNISYCNVCQSSVGYYLDVATGNCLTCSIAGCLNCTSLTTCSVCDGSSNYVHSVNTCIHCNESLNQFANFAGGTCDTCIISDCLTCSTLTACQVCDATRLYYLTPSLTCDYCDPLQNYFLDVQTGQCDGCIVQGCLNCSTNITCTICDTSLGYYLNGTTCDICSIVNCAQCTNSTTCTSCVSGFVVNTATYQCEICTLVGCLNCTTNAICSECNATANFVLLANGSCQQCTGGPGGTFENSVTGTCDPCPIANCTTCQNLQFCSVCDPNASSYLTISFACAYCDPNANNFINLTNLLCQPCTPTYCLACSSLTACSVCNNLAGYFLNTTDYLCYPCQIQGCLQCNTLYTCNNSCNTSARYQYNVTTQLCQLCVPPQFINATSLLCQACSIPNCLTCATLSTCSACDYNNSFYLLANLTCGYCDNLLDAFINASSLACQNCSLAYCLDCANLTTCLSCNNTAAYFLNSTDSLCYACSLANCLTCANLTTCSQCDEANQYFLNSSSGLCQLCSLTGCLNCTSLTVCNECDNSSNYYFDWTSPNLTLCGECNVSCMCDGYVLPWLTSLSCSTLCGDGLIRVDEQCDDSNNISGDGCSSSCLVEMYWACDGAEPTSCNMTLYIPAVLVSVEKHGCNSLKITANSPNFALSQIAQNILILNDGVHIISTAENGSNIEIVAQYSRDIVNETILLHFSPGDLLHVEYNPDVPALYYSQNECQGAVSVEQFLNAAQGVSYGILIVSLLSCKIVGLELFGVLQLAYFTLSSHSFLNLYLQPLTKFRTFNGLNIALTTDSADLPSNYLKMGLAGSFINNCNLMLFLLFGQLLVSLIAYIISKIMRSQNGQKFAKRLLKQGFITLVLFNIFNVAFSAGVHWKYAEPSDQNYMLSTVILITTLVAMIISVTAMELTAKQDYGQYKNKFKRVWICQLYIPLTVIYRMVLGFYTAIKSDYEQSTLIILAFTLAFILYTLVNLPFGNVFQNYRCTLIHVTMMFSLLTTNYYRSMKSNTPMQIKAKIHTPAIIQLLLIGACITISFLVLCYQIYITIQQCRAKKSIKNNGEERSRANMINQSIETIHN